MLVAFATLAALLLLAVTLQDAFEVILLPRRVTRRWGVMRLWFRVAWLLWSRAAKRGFTGERREHFLAVFGPLAMVTLFAIWASGLIIGFGLLDWSLQSASASGDKTTLFAQIYMSGVTFFTVGYGDVVPLTSAARVVSIIEGGTGIGFIAAVIGYLPVLYQLFSRREAHVIQLDARAGSPPTAVTMLCRHAENGPIERLDILLREWEVWGAELLESHLSYPMLAYYRSQHDNQSWLAASAAIMDTCALILVGATDIHPLQARMTFAMVRQVIVEMARSSDVRPSRYTGDDRLGDAGYARMVTAFDAAGVTWNPGTVGQETLAALRATYEPLLDGMAKHLLLPLPGWLADEDASDHWERGHRGVMTRRLIEQLGDRGQRGDAALDDPADAGNGARPLWQRVRSRLRTP